MSTLTTLIVIDTETTGTNPEIDKVVEIAMVPVFCASEMSGNPLGSEARWVIQPGASSLVNPRIPIPPEASAVHHLVDEDVKEAPHLLQAIVALNPRVGITLDTTGLLFVAHNAAFDFSFIRDYSAKSAWICTWRCAMHLWPEAPGYGNQVLRYWLGVQPNIIGDRPRDLQPHSALYDSYTTAGILLKMLELKSPEELLHLSTQPVLLRKCRFGKYYDKLWADVPRNYLQWILRQGGGEKGFDSDTRYTAEYYLKGVG